MLLAVDVGNSTTVLGLLDGEQLVRDWRLSTVPHRTGDELALLLAGMLRGAGVELRGDDLDGVVLASVVPPVTEVVVDIVGSAVDAPLVVVAPGTRTGIPLRYEDPREMGADRIANAVAAGERFGGPVVVVDFGTSTTVDAIDRDGGFLGGAIAPGVAVSAEALVAHAAQLPEVVLRRPRSAIGRTTVQALQSGIVHGAAAQVDGLVRRIADELGPGVTVVATGGMAQVVLETCTTIDHHDPHLTLHGLRLIFDRNQR